MKMLTATLCHMLGLCQNRIIILTSPVICYNKRTREFKLTDNPDNWVSCYGVYVPRDSNHIIILSDVYCKNDDIRDATLAHELIHAWQYQNMCNRMRHGKRDYFTQWSEYILENLGIDSELQV